MILLLFGFGIFGILGLSVLCPLLALSSHYLRRKNTGETLPLRPGGPDYPSSLEIIIPAHNEAALIGATLESIQRSIAYLRASPWVLFPPEIVVRVVADGCTDQTAAIASQSCRVTVTETKERQSKWVIVKTLAEATSAEWLFLVDAGVLWSESFLAEAIHRIGEHPNVMAIAPAYYPMKAGWFHRILWKSETALKKLEAFCGGPVSLHGATVAYKAPPLKKALSLLGETQWLNDDVVIPLMMRVHHPEGVILYPVGEVQDAGLVPNRMDLGRRKRLLLGNLQWVRGLLLSSIKRNPVAGVMAGRRLFRVFWAYWFAFTVLGFILAFHFVVFPMTVSIGILTASSGAFRQFIGAALISLLAPVLLFQLERAPAGAWK